MSEKSNRVIRMFHVVLCLPMVLLFVPLSVGSQTLPQEVIAYPDAVFYNGKVLTADDSFTVAEAVAVRDGKFLAVGQTARILQMVGPASRKIDLKGKTVVPGFFDTHYHLDDYAVGNLLMKKKGIAWEGRLIRNAILWPDAATALRDVQKAVAAAKPGELIQLIARDDIVNGSPSGLRDILLSDLDAVSPKNPVVLRSYIPERILGVNSATLQWAEAPSTLPGLSQKGGSCLIGPAASDFIYRKVMWAIPIEDIMGAIQDAMREVNSWGVTLVETRIDPANFSALRELWVEDALTVRWRVGFPGPIDVSLVGNLSDLGDDMLRVSGVDGGGSTGGAPHGGDMWTFKPPQRSIPARVGHEDPSQYVWRGRERLIEAIRYGWSVPNTHVGGDRATHEFLKAIENGVKSRVVQSRGQRLTMDHTMMASSEDIAKMKDLGVMPSIAPWFHFWEGMIDNLTYMYGGDWVSTNMMPIKSYIRAGLRPALESDVVEPPVGMPLWKIEKAVTRKDYTGRAWSPEERVTREEALWMATHWAAEATGDADKLGTIEVGKLADFVVLDRDYLRVPEGEISGMQALMTVVGGKIAYERGLD